MKLKLNNVTANLKTFNPDNYKNVKNPEITNNTKPNNSTKQHSQYTNSCL